MKMKQSMKQFQINQLKFQLKQLKMNHQIQK